MAKVVLISIVDDDESVREATKGLMKSLGFAAECFACAEDFLHFNHEHQNHTACLIADVQMPGMSGLDLFRRLTTSGRSIPTILITAYPDEGMRARALQAGVIGYLAKPFNENELLRHIHSVLGPREGEEAGP